MRRPSFLATFVSFALVLAGCATTPDAPVDDPAAPTGPSSLARFTTIVDERGGMGEPSLGVAPDGTLFTNGVDHAADRFDSGAVYRSKDGGATWEAIGAPASPFPNLDPDLVVDRDGVVWYSVLYLGCNAVGVSQDGGETWSTNYAVCNGPVGDRQYVVATGGGTAYLYYHQVPTFQQTAMKTTDHGRTWTPLPPTEPVRGHLTVNEGSGWGGGGFHNPVSDSVFFTYTWWRSSPTGAEGSWSPAATFTRDGGQTWTLAELDNAGGTAHGLSLVVGAADDAGNVYLAWAETDDKDSGVYFSSSTDDGATWSAPKRVDDGAASNVFPAIAAGPAGRVAIAYYEADEDGYPSDVSDDASWNVTLAWTHDALAASPAFERGTLSTNVVKRGPICPDGTVCDGDRQLLDYFTARRLPDGRVGVVWASTEDVPDETVNVYGATDAAILR